MYTQSPKQGFKKFQPLVIVNLVAFPPFNASPCGPSYKVSYGLDFFFSFFGLFFLCNAPLELCPVEHHNIFRKTFFSGNLH